MKTKTIKLSVEDVKDIIDRRKTTTRLEIKPQPELIDGKMRYKNNDVQKLDFVRCAPYAVGDLLAVKEPFAVGEIQYGEHGDSHVLLQNTGVNQIIPRESALRFNIDTSGVIWKPAEQMKKSDSRLILEVLDIGYERLQDISEDAAKKEGSKRCFEGRHPLGGTVIYCDRDGFYDLGFKARWDNRATKSNPDEYAWDTNPYVWIIEFKINTIVCMP